MEILITVCARGGSKGIPGKNIRLLNGRPLIAYTLDTAVLFATKYQADITVNSDSDEIKQVAQGLGISSTYVRPAELATDNAGKLDAIEDVLHFEEKTRQKKYDYILDLDVTSPLRNMEDLDAAFQMILQDAQGLNLFSVNHANRNPYFNMVELQPNGYYGLIKNGHFLTRQSAPQVYDLNASFYFYKRVFFNEKTPVINEHTMIYVMPHACFDLDHPIDFEFMEYLMMNNKLGFEL